MRRLFLLSLIGCVIASPARAGEKPADTRSTLQKLADSTGPSEPVSVAGVRGLDKGSGATGTGARDYKAVDRMEAVKIPAQDLDAFAAEGHLK